jgi:hypothetical protein
MTISFEFDEEINSLKIKSAMGQGIDKRKEQRRGSVRYRLNDRLLPVVQRIDDVFRRDGAAGNTNPLLGIQLSHSSILAITSMANRPI